jgi:multidrug transporter EmrE-like cation transporter
MKTVLTYFGASVSLTNAAIYVFLKESLKFHGRVQMALIVIGVLALVIGVYMPKKPLRIS